MSIELTNNSQESCDEKEIINVAKFALDKMGIHPDSELSITLVDESEMEELHIQWMDLPGPTDVLSFPMDEMRPNTADIGPGILGDIMISPEFAQISATQNNKTLQSEIELLLVHGILH